MLDSLTPPQENGGRYDLYYPVITRMAADGSGAKVIKSGLLTFSGGTHFFDWYVQPDVSPDGKTIALITNYPNPFNLFLGPHLGFLPAGGRHALGADPRPVQSARPQRSGLEPRRQAGRLHLQPAVGGDRRSAHRASTPSPPSSMRFLSAAGYARPSWSPDGKWIAAEKTDGKGRDVVILNASTGAEVARLTNDGESFAPTWSPDGTAVAFLHAQGDRHRPGPRRPGARQPVRDGPDHRPHRVEPARRDLAAGLVHPGLGAAHAGAHRAARQRCSVERAVAQRAVTSAIGPGDGSRGGYEALLEARVRRTGTLLCLGLDPDPAAFPRGFAADAAGAERFARLVLEAALPYAAAVKVEPRLLRGLRIGRPGRARAAAGEPARRHPLHRRRQARRHRQHDRPSRRGALYDDLGAHAVTVAPVRRRRPPWRPCSSERTAASTSCAAPRIRAPASCRTWRSAPTQASGAPGEPLYLRVARLALAWQATYGTVGLVVGATAPAELAAVRRIAPGLPFLVPGVGAQGGDAAAVRDLAAATDGPLAGSSGRGVLVNVSRGIAAAGLGAADPGAAIAAAAADWAARLRCYDVEPPQRTPLEDPSPHA